MRFLIVEQRFGGHLLVYVRILAEFALRHGHTVTLAIPEESRRTKEFRAHLGAVIDRITVRDIDAPIRMRKIEEMARDCSADVVVVPHADELATQSALGRGYRGPGRLRLLVMRDPRWEVPSPAHRRLRNAIKLRLLRRTARRDKTDLIWLREQSYTPHTELFARDPFIADGTLAEIERGALELRQRLALDVGTFWFGVVGAVSGRKNVPVVLESLAQVAKQHPATSIGFAIMGRLEQTAGFTESELIERALAYGIRVRIDNRLFSNQELNSAVSALDAVVMAYSTHAPNSTLEKARVLGTRLVAAGPPSIRRFVRESGAGWESELSIELLAFNLGLALQAEAPDSDFDRGVRQADEFAFQLFGTQ